jgi:predicted MFS family arabinose efflux permease
MPSLTRAFIFALAVAVVNGFARFAYALILPVMRSDLQWDYALSGWLNTANSIGYMLGGLSGLLLLTRVKPSTLFATGLVASALTLLCVSFTRDIAWMMFFRLITGIGSAWVFACGGAMVAAHYSAHAQRAGTAIAIYFSGGGLGILLSGLLMAPLLKAQITWSQAWLALAAASAVLMIAPIWLSQKSSGTQQNKTDLAMPWRDSKPFTVAYFLFGAGYIVYMTFVIAWLKEMQLPSEASIALWVLMGAACMASGWVWRKAMAQWWPPHTFAAACLCTGLGSALPLLSRHPVALALSVLLVGGSFFMVPGAVTAFCRKSLPQALWAKGMNYFTMIFAVGQAVGPVVAGEIADRFTLNAAMVFGALALAAGAGLALWQKPVKS